MSALDDEQRRQVAYWRSVPRGRPEHAEVPGPGQESVWDYPRPPRLERVGKSVRVEFAGQIVAETHDALRICETASPATYYLPVRDVQKDCLVPAGGSSLCEWKGAARYFHIDAGNARAERAAWGYDEPLAPFEALAGHVAIFAGRVDACFVGDARVIPQPGPFYGGWITPDLVGPWKGEPGTEHW
ncbi:MAG: DUF427 domain-containing protein [Myxococcota bacterium]